MKILNIKISPNYKVLFFIVNLFISIAIFYIDIKYLPGEITLLLPYVFIISLSTFYIGNKSGLFLSLLTIFFWFYSKMRLVTTFTLLNYFNTLIKSIFIILQYLLVAYIKRLYFKVVELALVDELTGLSNRRGFYHLAQYEINNINRKKEFISLMFIDIDNFKEANDTKGHKEGDRILKELSRIIQKNIRKGDISARIGGDEFCILLLNTNKNTVENIYKRMIHDFYQVCKRNLWLTTLSIGVFITKKSFKVDELIKRSDDLMYKAKKSGKNKIKFDSI